MSGPQDSPEIRGGPAQYQIRVKEHLDARWAARFGGMRLSHEQDGTTLSGLVTDQAALHGVLRRVLDSGLSLMAVIQGAPGGAAPPEVRLDQGQRCSDP